MAKLSGIYKENISLSGIIELLKDNIMSNLNCHNIGKIIEFDKTTQTCTVELMQIKQFNDNFFIPAPITQVPLIIYGAGQGHITLPNPVGSICLLLFLDRNIDNFMETGEQYVPETSRMHDFTDCVALTTFTTLANPLSNYDEEAISIFNKKLVEEVESNSYVKVYGDSINIKTSQTDNSITVDQEISLDNEGIDISSSLGGNITVDAQIGISNTVQDLGLLIQAFITACENITITNNQVSQTSKDTFENLKTQFAALIKTPTGDE